MKKIWNKRKSLLVRLWMSIICISVILVLAVNIKWYRDMKDKIYKNEIQSASSLLYQLNMRIENIFNFININSLSFLIDTQTRNILGAPAHNEEQRLKNEKYICDIFKKMKTNNSMICSMEFVGKHYNISSEMDEQAVDFEKLKQYEWYSEFSDYYVEMVTPVYRNDYIEKFDTRVIGWIRKIDTFGHFLIEISYSSISSIMKEAISKSGNQIFVFDKRGNIIFEPEGTSFSDFEMMNLIDQVKTSEDYFEFKSQEKEYTCFFEMPTISNWYIVMLLDQQKLTTYIMESVKQTMGFGLFIVAVGFILAYGISKYITKPIYQLVGVMKQVENNQLDVSVPGNQSIIEIDVLSHGFNKMLTNIRNLIENIRKEEQEKKEMEIRMLQEQINPHFLYNTLNVIRWKAIMHGEETISKMIIALIRLLEFSGKRTDIIITVEKEVQHAVSYLDLIQYQYPDDFDVVCDIDSKALSCYTVKFILQPLVENAVFHGIEPLDEKGKIFLEIKHLENRISFKVEDNGVGIPEDVQKNISAFRGLGIYNVNERLKKHYGEDSMLKIESEEGRGTRISFEIPVVSERN